MENVRLCVEIFATVKVRPAKNGNEPEGTGDYSLPRRGPCHFVNGGHTLVKVCSMVYQRGLHSSNDRTLTQTAIGLKLQSKKKFQNYLVFVRYPDSEVKWNITSHSNEILQFDRF